MSVGNWTVLGHADPKIWVNSETQELGQDTEPKFGSRLTQKGPSVTQVWVIPNRSILGHHKPGGDILKQELVQGHNKWKGNTNVPTVQIYCNSCQSWELFYVFTSPHEGQNVQENDLWYFTSKLIHYKCKGKDWEHISSARKTR